MKITIMPVETVQSGANKEFIVNNARASMEQMKKTFASLNDTVARANAQREAMSKMLEGGNYRYSAGTSLDKLLVKLEAATSEARTRCEPLYGEFSE